jgi:hypothetical protein
MKRHRIRTALKGLALTALLWAILVALAILGNATWPHATPNVPTCFTYKPIVFHPERCQTISASENWQTFVVLGVIVEFLWLKSYMMTAMTLRRDWLGSSLIAANIAFSVIYLLAMALMCWPSWQWGSVRARAAARCARRDSLLRHDPTDARAGSNR